MIKHRDEVFDLNEKEELEGRIKNTNARIQREEL